jgi:8-oxo-dGTP diphosphatase
MSGKKNTHCSYCGNQFDPEATFPRACNSCLNVTYINPLPVAVTLIGTRYQESTGVILVQRNIEPKKGMWALPGGYLEAGETWQEGTVREIREEIGLVIPPSDIELKGVTTAMNGNLLIFSSTKTLIPWDQIVFDPNTEVSALGFSCVEKELAFPSHTEYLNKYLKEIA